MVRWAQAWSNKTKDLHSGFCTEAGTHLKRSIPSRQALGEDGETKNPSASSITLTLPRYLTEPITKVGRHEFFDAEFFLPWNGIILLPKSVQHRGTEKQRLIAEFFLVARETNG